MSDCENWKQKSCHETDPNVTASICKAVVSSSQNGFRYEETDTSTMGEQKGCSEETLVILDDRHSSDDNDPVDCSESDARHNGSPIDETEDKNDAGSSASSVNKEEKMEEPDIIRPRLKYSRDQLLKLMDVPASRLWPDYFDISYQKPQGKIDLEKWMRAKQDCHRGQASSSAAGPQANGVSSNNCSERPPDLEIKKSRDPRERVKHEEQDGIVLSPQRRSFGTGCHVLQQPPSSQAVANGPDSSTDRSTRESHREIPTRRIGSGRIPRRDDPEQIGINDRRRDREIDRERETTDQRRDAKDWRNKNDARYERDERHEKRRRFFEEEDKRNDRRDGRDMRDRRFHDHRRPSKDTEEEAPEWFTGGPSSQNEFIELVGFEESEERSSSSKPKRERRRSKKEKDGGSRKSSRSNTPVIIEKELTDEVNEEANDCKIEPSRDEEHLVKIENPIVIEPPENEQDVMEFNIEDYLGDILNMASDDIGQSNGGSSRLKQFFKDHDSPVLRGQQSGPDSRRSSMDISSHFGSLLGFSEPVIQIPSPNSSHIFAPISPADKTSGDTITDLLQHATSRKPKQPVVVGSGRLPPPSVKDLLMGGKGQSLEEIEANMIKGPTSIPTLTSDNGTHPSCFHQANMMSSQMRQPNGNCSQNPFNNFLSQVSQGPRKVMAEQEIEPNNVLSRLLKDSMQNKNSLGKKPALPNNAPTESELIARLLKGSGLGAMNGCTPLSQLNCTIAQGVPASQHNFSNLNLMSQSLAPNMGPHSPSRSQLMPPPQQLGQLNQDLLLKLVQSQQQLQNQKKQQMLHPNYHHHQQQQQQHMDPIKQLVGGMNNLGMGPTPPHPQDAALREALLRSDVQNLMQRVLSGQIKDAQLVAQLNSGSATMQQREAITAVLKILNSMNRHPSGGLMPPRTTLTPSPTPQGIIGGSLTLGTTPSSLSPRVASPNPETTNMLAPHMIQQTRVSPLMFTGSTPRRPPSHQELVVHAQSILQKALLKQELEKAKEKHRKREAERTRSPNPVALQNGPNISGHNMAACRINQDGSPSKGAKCQSPLVFTPTSVMRKMTAEKDRIGDKGDKTDNNSQQLDKLRDQPPAMNPVPGYNVQAAQNLKIDNRIRRVPSPISPCNSLLGPKAQMVMSGQNPAFLNMGPTHGIPPPQRHIPMQSNMGVGRPNQHNINNIRVLQHAQAQAAMTHQLLRNGPPNIHVPPPPHPHLPIQTRLPNSHNSNAVHHMVLANNNNLNPKQGETNLQIPHIGGSASHRNSPVSLMNLFGRDVMAQVQASAMPELPGGKVLSLEEVERLQQTQPVPN